MESAPLDAMKISVLDRFGIIPDKKYLVWKIFSSLQHVAVTGPL